MALGRGGSDIRYGPQYPNYAGVTPLPVARPTVYKLSLRPAVYKLSLALQYTDRAVSGTETNADDISSASSPLCSYSDSI